MEPREKLDGDGSARAVKLAAAQLASIPGDVPPTCEGLECIDTEGEA
jgi:hypothetical protein